MTNFPILKDSILKYTSNMKSEDLLAAVKRNPFLLAPMAGVTDVAFRSYMVEMGCGVVISELVSAKGIQYESAKTLNLLRMSETERPVGIQVFGEDLESLHEAAKVIEGRGADFIDLNFGCPVPKVVKKGAGSAVLKDLVQLGKVVHAVKSGTKLPVTIKVRTGWDHDSKNSLEVAKVAFNEGATWMAMHGRTRSQAYKGFADWGYISEVAKESPLPVIGNGDLVSPELCVSRLKESGCFAVMIGRGCLKNPWIFKQSKALLMGEKPVKRDYLFSVDRLKYHLEKYYEGKKLMIQLKKLSAWQSAGFSGSAQFRRNVFRAESYDEICGIVEEFFEPLQNVVQEDTSHEDFLMGGHG